MVALAEPHKATLKSGQNLPGDFQAIRILSVPDDYNFCTTSVGKIYINGLTNSIKVYMERYYQLKPAITNAEARVEQMQISVSATKQPTAGATKQSSKSKKKSAAPVKSASDLAKKKSDLASLKSKLASMKKELASMEPVFDKKTTVKANNTGRTYSGNPIWQYVGELPAPAAQ